MTDHRKIAVYIRLSAEDDNVDGRAKKESDSVTSQRILLKSFVIDQLGVLTNQLKIIILWQNKMMEVVNIIY